MARSVLVHSHELERYNFGVGHPMGPGRIELTLRLARRLGLLDSVSVIEPPLGDQTLLRTVHDEVYIAAVRSDRAAPMFGVGTADNPLVPGMHDIASQIVAATTEAARQVWTGQFDRAINISGGLHHAMPMGTSGFCVYNDLGVAINWLKAHGAKRVAYVDVDAHHGDGVQGIFYNDPDVLTLSLHEDPTYLFPGTGYPTESGGPEAVGTSVNVALPPGTGDAGWLRAFDAIVPPVLEAFGPDIVITQHGSDSHAEDPLTDLKLSLGGQAKSYRLLGDLVDRFAHGRWVVTGGGGYAMPFVVPRAWAQLIAVVTEQPLDPTTPMPTDWLPPVWQGASPVPGTVGDPEPDFTPISDGVNPSDPVDQAILATRRAVFPELGLDPGAY